MMRRPLLAGVAALSLAIAPAAATTEPWTRAFTASLWQPNERDVVTVDNQTLRTQVRVNAGGEAVRVWFGNDFGRMPVRIGRASVRTNDGRVVPLRFGGRDGARIAVGASLASDPVSIATAPFEIIELRIYLPETSTLVGVHDTRANPLEISLPGDFLCGGGLGRGGEA